MGIGMHRRHYAIEPDSAHVVLEPTGIPEGNEGGVVAIGDEPGTAPTPSTPDAEERDLQIVDGRVTAPIVQAKDANEKPASKDEFGDAEHSVDPEGHPVDHEKVEDNLEEAGLTDESGTSLGGSPTAPEAPARGASKAIWETFYTEQLGQDPAGRGRDQLANDYLGEKSE